MLIKKTLLTLMALFMSVSGMPVYAEQAPEPEVTETDKKIVPETGIASALGVKKLEAEENIASGTWGTCPWTIDANGVLTIGAGTGKSLFAMSKPPWNAYSEKITSVKTSGKVVFPENCYGLFAKLSNCTSFSLLNVDTSNVVVMNSVFGACTASELLGYK